MSGVTFLLQGKFNKNRLKYNRDKRQINNVLAVSVVAVWHAGVAKNSSKSINYILVLQSCAWLFRLLLDVEKSRCG